MLTFLPVYQLMLDLKGQAEEQDLPYVNEGGFAGFLTSMLQALMAIGAITVLIFLLWGAFDWINASGEKGKIESARNKMTGAIIGLLVLTFVLVIFMFIQRMLGIELFQFIPSNPVTPIQPQRTFTL
jgi:hypothetical protein